jgi:hypothetical protein
LYKLCPINKQRLINNTFIYIDTAKILWRPIIYLLFNFRRAIDLFNTVITRLAISESLAFADNSKSKILIITIVSLELFSSTYTSYGWRCRAAAALILAVFTLATIGSLAPRLLLMETSQSLRRSYMYFLDYHVFL